ncbi:vWA domain-containing protein [Zavarzinella formosa]|uniref:vWA domain-containing protein n=1 Tax=Zavarzinella formosa TaxID=360055 RepID=UPI00030E2875|nr:VWA domain-containing protein [Zavarzinella formosa]
MLCQRFARRYPALFAAALIGLAGCAKTDPPVARQAEPTVVETKTAVAEANPKLELFDEGQQPPATAAIQPASRESKPRIPAASIPEPAARDYSGSVIRSPNPDPTDFETRFKHLDMTRANAPNRSQERLGANRIRLQAGLADRAKSSQKGEPLYSDAPAPGPGGGKTVFAKPGRDGENYDDADSQGEAYQHLEDNAFKTVKVDPLSTLSAAVDTAAYSNSRSRLNEGALPPKDMVRIADFLNYFPYDYAAPTDGKPVNFKLEMAACPWNEKHNLLKIGLKSKVIEKDKLPARNLVFLIDTSGSMNSPNRLPLVIESMKLLVEQLSDRDRVSIVTYAGAAGLRLPPTPGNQKEKIINEITNLQSGGSTNGEGGIKLAYEQAEKTFIKEGINRVILATDGDFNVGVSDNAQLIRMIEDKRKTGVYLTILGYGMGNLHDDRLEQLAHHGNGHYAYIDSLDEAKKLFVEQGAALVTVAKDVKLQIEFNPAKIAGYRLIGYENRILKTEDFRNDAKDAGDMGCGHTCTMLFEIVPVGEKVPSSDVEPLKYQTTPQLTDAGKSGEWLTTRMRYKDPETDKASEVSASFDGKDIAKEPGKDFRFAASVAAYGMLLRDSDYVGSTDLEKVLTWSKGSLGEDKGGHRAEFTRLVEKTKDIVTKKREQAPAVPPKP